MPHVTEKQQQSRIRESELRSVMANAVYKSDIPDLTYGESVSAALDMAQFYLKKWIAHENAEPYLCYDEVCPSHEQEPFLVYCPKCQLHFCFAHPCEHLKLLNEEEEPFTKHLK